MNKEEKLKAKKIISKKNLVYEICVKKVMKIKNNIKKILDFFDIIHKKIKGVVKMKKYVCVVCGYVYDPEVGDTDGGVAAGTSFEEIPEEWVCPVCGVGKDQFEEA